MTPEAKLTNYMLPVLPAALAPFVIGIGSPMLCFELCPIIFLTTEASRQVATVLTMCLWLDVTSGVRLVGSVGRL